MWVVGVMGWCVFLFSLCAALYLDQKIIGEVEKDVPLDQRRSFISLNGRQVAREARKRHRLLFPDSRLRLLNLLAWGATFLSLFATLSLSSQIFRF
jgi:hypothetical protein